MRAGTTISKQKELIEVIRRISRGHFWYAFVFIIINLAIIVIIASGVIRISKIASEGVALVSSSHGAGSGFLINEEGYMLTANHVVKGDQEVSVQFRDGTYSEAKVLIEDEAHDIALLKLNDISSLPSPLALGDSDIVSETQQVYVIGYPGGEYSITEGIISQKTENYIKTDAAVNPGNSGGPLLTKNDRIVIGVVVSTKIIAGDRAEGLHYAVPINVVEEAIRQKGSYEIR